MLSALLQQTSYTNALSRKDSRITGTKQLLIRDVSASIKFLSSYLLITLLLNHN